MDRFTPTSALTCITLLIATIPIPASSHEVTGKTIRYEPVFGHSPVQEAASQLGATGRAPHSPTSQPQVMMNSTIPTAHQFRLKVAGFQDKTVVTFGKLESTLTLQIPLSEIDPEFYDWINMPKSDGGHGDRLSSTVRMASLITYNAEGKEVLRWNLSNAWVKTYKVPKLNALNNDSAVATLEMAFDDIQQGE